MTQTWTLTELADMLAGIETDLSGSRDQEQLLDSLTRMAVRRIPHAEFAGITRNRDGSLRSVATTDDLVRVCDKIQYRAGAGPCVDAIDKETHFLVSDLRSEPRWPEFGRQAAEQTGILSMLAFRLVTEEDPGLDAALNLYSTQESAFDESDKAIGLLLATAGALAVSGAQARDRAENLERALQNSRTIGVAMGVLMSQHKVTRERAFDLLRLASQNTNRKLADLANEVERTGALPDLPRMRRADDVS